MGGGASKQQTITNMIDTKALTEVLNKNTVSCNTNVLLSQEINVQGSGNILEDIKQSSALKLDASCYNKSSNITEIQNIIETNMKAKLDTIEPALLAVANTSKSKLTNDLSQEIKNVITTENMTKIINNVNQDQIIKVRGDSNILRNMSQQSTIDMIASGIQDSFNSTKTMTDLKNAQDLDSKSKVTDPINDAIKGIMDGINGIFSSYTTAMIFIVVIIAVAFILLGPTLLSAFQALNPFSALSFGNKKTTTTYQQQPPQQFRPQQNPQQFRPPQQNQQTPQQNQQQFRPQQQFQQPPQQFQQTQPQAQKPVMSNSPYL